MDLNNLVLNSTGIGAGIGAALPLLIAVLLRPHWSAAVKHWIVGGLAVLSGVGTVAAQGGFNTSSSPLALIGAISAVYAASQIAYAGLWHPTGIAPSIETATSPAPIVPADLPPVQFPTLTVDAASQVQSPLSTAELQKLLDDAVDDAS